MRRHLGLALAIAACTPASPPAPPPTPGSAAPIAKPETNIARADYVGPRVCGDCHAGEYARWSQSLHRVMNARADDDGAIAGDFANALVRYAGGEARFTHDRDGYRMVLARGGREVRYRVTRTIGRRGLQEYVGLEDDHTDEVRLPFGWWPRRGGWYPQPYFDPWLVDESMFDPYVPVREPWAERCPWCHSTYPFEQRIARASGPSGLGHGMEQMFAGTPGSERLVVAEQVTTGISCESCHLGGRTHAAGGAIHLVPQGATPRDHATVPNAKFADERRNASIVNAVCAQCHSGPSPRLPDHTALRNSSEALDLDASPCTGIKCTDCHDPHRADARASDVDARSIAACTHCHTALAEPAAARAHGGTGHATTSCLDCHMPKLVVGIDRFVRTHRIGSPTDRATLADAGPNACNLCHLDRSIAWTVDELHRGWDTKLARPRTREADTAVGERWLASTQPSYRLIAQHAYARNPVLGKRVLPSLVAALADPQPYARMWTLFAIEDVLGKKIPIETYDPRADAATRTRQLAALRITIAR